MKILSQTMAVFSRPVQNNQNQTYVQTNPARLRPLAQDTVSFSANAPKTFKAAINLVRKTILDLPQNLEGKRVFLKVDHNLPKGDNTRMVATIPTIKELMNRNGRLIIGTHIGDPFKVKDGQKGKFVSTKENAAMLQELLRREKGFENTEVIHVPHVTGTEVEKAAKNLKPNQILYLENLRVTPAETGKTAVPAEAAGTFKSAKVSDVEQDAHARELAALADFYVNDAFGTGHRDHASVSGITKHLPGAKVAGILMDNEVKAHKGFLEAPREGFVAIVGGAKVGDKIEVLQSLIPRSEKVIIGGAMAHTFTKALGGDVGKSLVENDKLDLARKVLEDAKKHGTKIILPVDAVAALKMEEGGITRVVKAGEIPDEMMGLDIGPESVKNIKNELKGAKHILWNGPMGVFELDRFAKGTNAVVEAVAQETKKGAKSLLGGGDTGKAVLKSGHKADNFTHLSTGGGASQAMVEKLGDIPGIRTLDEK